LFDDFDEVAGNLKSPSEVPLLNKKKSSKKSKSKKIESEPQKHSQSNTRSLPILPPLRLGTKHAKSFHNQIKQRDSLNPHLSKSISELEHHLPPLQQTISEVIRESNLDLAYLYADPLLTKVTILDRYDKPVREEIHSFNQPLSTEKEFDKIWQMIKQTGRRFTIRREVANFEKIKSVMAEKPIMLHISCHGDCYWDYKQKKNTYFLALEGTEKKICLLD